MSKSLLNGAKEKEMNEEIKLKKKILTPNFSEYYYRMFSHNIFFLAVYYSQFIYTMI